MCKSSIPNKAYTFVKVPIDDCLRGKYATSDERKNFDRYYKVLQYKDGTVFIKISTDKSSAGENTQLFLNEYLEIKDDALVCKYTPVKRQ